MTALSWRLAAALLAVASPALAQPGPATLPQRDVIIVYRLEGALRDVVPGGLPETVRLLWDAGRQRLRLEPQGGSQLLLVDLAAPRAQLIDSGLHSVIDLPLRPKDVAPLLLRDTRLTRRGAATIAGLPCTDYAAESRRGHGTVCLTSDGIALRAVGEVDGKSGSLIATSVAPGPVAAAAFDPPHGYMRLAIPDFGGASGRVR